MSADYFCMGNFGNRGNPVKTELLLVKLELGLLQLSACNCWQFSDL